MESEDSRTHALESSSDYNIYLYVTSTDAEILSDEIVNHQIGWTTDPEAGFFFENVGFHYYFEEDGNGQRLTKLSYNTPGQDVIDNG